MSWRKDPPPLPTWRDFARRAWDAMFNIEKMAETIEKAETAAALERIEGHLVVLSEHAESATLARRRGSVLRSRAIAEADRTCFVRVIQESSGFDEKLRVEPLPPGGEGICEVRTSPHPFPNDKGQTLTIFSLCGPPTCHIVEIRLDRPLGGPLGVFRGNARVVELDIQGLWQGVDPAIVTISIYQRSPTGES
jgi:hypothetical protein